MLHRLILPANPPSDRATLLTSAIFPPLLWAGLIFFLSSQSVLPGLTVSLGDFLLKKTAHIFVYAVLYLLLFRATFLLTDRVNQPRRQLLLAWLPLILCLIYAISDEVHQTFTPGRNGSVIDVGFDMIGASLAMLKTYRYI